MKAHSGSKGIAPLILDFGTRRVWLTSRPGIKIPEPIEFEAACSPENFFALS